MITQGLPVLRATLGKELVQLVIGGCEGREQLVPEAFPACDTHRIEEDRPGRCIGSPCRREASRGGGVALQSAGDGAQVELSCQNQVADDVAYLPVMARAGLAPGLVRQGVQVLPELR